jgi:hypothetical protein
MALSAVSDCYKAAGSPVNIFIPSLVAAPVRTECSLLGWPPRASPPSWCDWRLDRATPTTEPHFFRHSRTTLRIGGCGERMIGPQIPAGTIGVDAEPVLHLQMPAQGLGAKPAFETHDVIGLHRSPDRHRRLARLRWWRGGLSQTCKRPIDTGNQSRQFFGRDRVLSNVAADNLHNLIEINLPRRVVAFHVLPSGPCFDWPYQIFIAGVRHN